MPNCAIINCKNSTRVVSRVNGNVSFHRFPADPIVKEKWIDATGNKDWFPTEFSRICSIHFNEDEFVATKKCRRLCETAYPTLMVLNSITNTENITTTDNLTSDASKKRTLLTKNRRDEKVHIKQPSERERRLLHKIHQQALNIKRLKEQNRRKFKKIIALEAVLDYLKTKFQVKEAELKIVKSSDDSARDLQDIAVN